MKWWLHYYRNAQYRAIDAYSALIEEGWIRQFWLISTKAGPIYRCLFMCGNVKWSVYCRRACSSLCAFAANAGNVSQNDDGAKYWSYCISGDGISRYSAVYATKRRESRWDAASSGGFTAEVFHAARQLFIERPAYRLAIWLLTMIAQKAFNAKYSSSPNIKRISSIISHYW